MTYTSPSALAQDWAANNREATRDLLLSIAMSDLAVVTYPDKPDKIHKIKNGCVLYQINNPAHARELARKIVGGETLDPILVQEMRFQHILYYIPIEGNYASAAVAYIMDNKIRARIESQTDLSGISFRLGPQQRVLVETKPRGRSQNTWKMTSYTIETEAQRANFETMFNLQDYDHIRKQELAHETSRK